MPVNNNKLKKSIGLPLVLAFTFGMAACSEDASAPTSSTGKKDAPARTAEAPKAPPNVKSQTSQQAAQSQPTTGTTTEPGTSAADSTDGKSAQLSPGLYRADKVDLRLSDDGRFILTERSGTEEVRGSYEISDDVLILRNPTGDTQNANFPISCRAEADGDRFTLRRGQGSCPFDGFTFSRVS